LSGFLEVNNKNRKKKNPPVYCLDGDKCKPIYSNEVFYSLKAGYAIV